jgi:hypothetical protein
MLRNKPCFQIHLPKYGYDSPIFASSESEALKQAQKMDPNARSRGKISPLEFNNLCKQNGVDKNG